MDRAREQHLGAKDRKATIDAGDDVIHYVDAFFSEPLMSRIKYDYFPGDSAASLRQLVMFAQGLCVAVTYSSHQSKQRGECVGSAHAIWSGSDASLELPNCGICGRPKNTVHPPAVKAHMRQL
jgi:hypothetical protein